MDTYGSILYAILPELRSRFGLSLTKGIVLITIFNIGCNAAQLITGPMRPNKKKALFLYSGVALASCICLLTFVPRGNLAFSLLAVLAVISATGIAVLHPEGLRAVHILKRIPSTISTAVFLNAGYFGFCSGALVSSWLVYRLGLNGLLILFIPGAIAIYLALKARIRLAVEKPEKNQSDPDGTNIAFYMLYLMAIPIATTATLIPTLLPTRLNELGFELYFGGISLALFGFGGLSGALFWAKMAQSKNKFYCCIWACAMSIPFLLIFLPLIKYRLASLLLFGCGFNATAAYSLIVTMARHSTGTNLGKRMGLILGGVWGPASLIVLAFGPVAEKFGTQSVLNFCWLGYLLAVMIGIYAYRKNKRRSLTL